MAATRKYIRDQREKRERQDEQAGISFKAEFIGFLKKHGMDWKDDFYWR